MERGDLIFFYPRKTNFIQRAIRFFDGKYCHCGILLSKELVLSMEFSGVKIRNIKEYKNQDYDIFRIVNVEKKDKEKLLQFLISKMDTVNYDYWGVLKFLFNKIKNTPQKFYCSEFIVWGLFYIGLLPERLNLSPLQLSNQEFLIKVEV